MSAPHNPRNLELRIFKSGNSAALRLPKALGFLPGDRIVAHRDGNALVLRHADPKGWPQGYFESWEAASFELPKRRPASARDARMSRLYGKSSRG